MVVVLILVIILVVALLAALPGSAEIKGARGESRVSRALHRMVDPGEVHIIEDLTLPARGGTTQIDHVVLSRHGVFVIETKNMAGWIFGAEDQSSWTQVLYRKKTRFQNPLRQNHGHVRTITDLLGLEARQVHNVVAFVGAAEPRTPMPDNVVWSTRALAAFIATPRPVVLAPEALGALATRLTDARMEPGDQTRKAHVRHVKQTLAARGAARGADGVGCPTCGGEMVARRAKRTGQTFMGCARFPACRGMRPVVPRAENVVAFPVR